jgi:hypothetical protein
MDTVDMVDAVDTDREFPSVSIPEILVRHGQARADVVKCLPLRLSATLRETGCFALGWYFGGSPYGTLWQIIKSGVWAGWLRLFAA